MAERTADQSMVWTQTCFSIDAAQDDFDHDDSYPAEESKPSGIGDYDGLLEQVGSQDWQSSGQV